MRAHDFRTKPAQFARNWVALFILGVVQIKTKIVHHITI